MKASCLIVEQHRHHAEEIYRDIHELFEHYHIATTAEEALIYIKEHDFDMIIINPFFSDRSGRTFIHDLKDIRKLNMTPIIVLSELPAERVKLDFYSQGADVYLEMPYDKKAFFNRIREELLRHFQIIANHGRDKGSAFMSRDEFEKSYMDTQRFIRDNQEKGIIGLIAPAAMYYVIKEYGLETGIKLMTSLSQMMQKMCSEKLRATIWTQKTIVFIMTGMPEEMIMQGLDRVRKEYLERFSDIVKLQDTVGLRAVLSSLPIDKNLHETIDKLSIQLVQLSKDNKLAPLQFYGESVCINRRVMIADPDPVAANVIMHRLKQDGFNPIMFQDATDLVNHPDTQDIAAILIDTMVSGGGVNMIKRIQAEPDLATKPIMLLSRYGFENEITSAFQAGADDYIMKPFSMVELSARMKRLTG